MCNTIQTSTETLVPSWSVFEHKEETPNSSMHYLEDEDGIYAYAIINNESDNIGYFVHKIEVKESSRCKGVGGQLLQFLREKYGSIWLEPRNASHNFYLKRGAKPFATHSSGWLFAINDRLPTENWSLFCGETIFCEPPDNDFVYNEENWPLHFLEMCP